MLMGFFNFDSEITFSLVSLLVAYVAVLVVILQRVKNKALLWALNFVVFVALLGADFVLFQYHNRAAKDKNIPKSSKEIVRYNNEIRRTIVRFDDRMTRKLIGVNDYLTSPTGSRFFRNTTNPRDRRGQDHK